MNGTERAAIAVLLLLVLGVIVVPMFARRDPLAIRKHRARQ